MTDQTIFRRAKDRENPYVMIDREIFQNSTLSWKAKGLLGYLLSRPDDWIVRMTDLAKQSTDGMAAIRTAVKELEDAGYMVRQREQDDEGKFQWTVEVHEVPMQPSTENHHMDDPTIYRLSIDGLSTSGKPLDILSIDHTKEEDGAGASVSPGDQDLDDIDWHDGSEGTEAERSPKTDDPIEDAVNWAKRNGSKRPMSVPAAAGGADSYATAMFAAWVEGKGIDPAVIPKGEADTLYRRLAMVANKWHHATPQECGKAVLLLFSDERYNWYNYADPAVEKFKTDWKDAMAQILSGGVGKVIRIRN